jgi:dipeptidase E
MQRRDFLASSALASFAAVLDQSRLSTILRDAVPEQPARTTAAGRKILIAGGGFNEPFIRYMAALTGKPEPKLLYLPTATGDNPSSIVSWFQMCSKLNVKAFAQPAFISSYTMKQSWDEVLLSMDGIVASGGNTLNQQAIWKVQGIDVVLRTAWDRGIVLGGASAGSLCWFEEGTTDSRPKDITVVKCLGFLRGSHCPHYDGEVQRRPAYQRMIVSGELKPGYACDNNAGIYFEDNEAKRIVASRAGAKCYYVSAANGKAVERVLEPELIS